MACNSITLNGINSSCESSIGGIVEVYGIPSEYITGVTIASATGITQSASGVTAFGYDEAGHTASSWVLFKFRKNSSSMNKTYAHEDSTGYAAFETELTMLFTKMDAAKRAELVALAKGGARFIVKDANGLYWYLGKDNDVVVDQLTGQTGQNVTDGNYYQVVLKDTAVELPYEVDPELAKTIAAAIDAA